MTFRSQDFSVSRLFPICWRFPKIWSRFEFQTIVSRFRNISLNKGFRIGFKNFGFGKVSISVSEISFSEKILSSVYGLNPQGSVQWLPQQTNNIRFLYVQTGTPIRCHRCRKCWKHLNFGAEATFAGVSPILRSLRNGQKSKSCWRTSPNTEIKNKNKTLPKWLNIKWQSSF